MHAKRFLLSLIVMLLAPAVFAAGGFFELGLRQFEVGDYLGAEAQLTLALEKDSAHIDALLLMGEVKLHTGDAPGAETAISEALMQGADDPTAMTLLAEAYLKQGKLRSIVDKLPMTGRTSKQAAEVMGYQAFALSALSQPGQADALVTRALQSQPDALMPGVAKSQLLIKEGNLDEALTLALSLTTRYPNEARAWNNLATAAHVVRDHDLAVDAYADALSLDPHLLQARISRTRLLIYMGRDEESWDDLDFLEVFYPVEPRAAYARALVLERAGATAASQEEFRRCATILSRLPGYWIAQSEQLTMAAATSNIRIGDLESARGFLEAYRALGQENPAIARRLAAVLNQLEQRKKVLPPMAVLATGAFEN